MNISIDRRPWMILIKLSSYAKKSILLVSLQRNKGIIGQTIVRNRDTKNIDFYYRPQIILLAVLKHL